MEEGQPKWLPLSSHRSSFINISNSSKSLHTCNILAATSPLPPHNNISSMLLGVDKAQAVSRTSSKISLYYKRIIISGKAFTNLVHSSI